VSLIGKTLNGKTLNGSADWQRGLRSQIRIGCALRVFSNPGMSLKDCAVENFFLVA
jgi:hypothetical protein